MFQKRTYTEFNAGSKLNIHGLSKRYDRLCILDSNEPENTSAYTEHGRIIAFGAEAELVHVPGKGSLGELQRFCDQHQNWIFGYLGYDIKNDIEALSSANPDRLHFPALQFFVPRFVILQKKHDTEIHFPETVSEKELEQVIGLCFQEGQNTLKQYTRPEIRARVRRENYLTSVRKLKEHIRKGDIYEVNFCQEFYSENAEIDPPAVYDRLNSISKAPFSVYGKFGDHYLLCASPERFLKKKGDHLLSQPIKGTSKRSSDPEEDEKLKEELQRNQKERSENVMIVDLVRNDLSRIAKKGSVKVDELFGVYSFRQVHQMISTISCDVRTGTSFTDILRALYPMGSMTGAPKISAMKLIEEYESTKRGLYSGAVGYIDPKGNFDLNVVIRSILYNSKEKYLSFMVGSAITDKSDPEKEYEECLLKAKALFEVLTTRY